MTLGIVDVIKIVFLGIIEGITEWLPVSSTGHMLLADEFIKLNISPEFKDMFFTVIQLGAILAVVVLFRKRMFPFRLKSKSRPVVRKDVFSIWFKTAVACIPGAIATLLFDDYIEAHFETPFIIAAALMVYGVAFIVIESANKYREPKIKTIDDISYRTALYIGMFQVLSIIPGTSRSGATIIGALLIGVSRVAAAEFTFFLAVPVMAGLSVIKIIGFGFDYSSAELLTLATGTLTAFAVSLGVVKFLMSFIKRHNFSLFGYYRIGLAVLIIIYFTLRGTLI